ncbi:MAG: DUF1987 domain-containing protein [Pseudodesulfovibrio sp.]
MQDIYLPATETTPEVSFNFERNDFLLRGASYPEDPMKTYGPLFDALKPHLKAVQSDLLFTFELTYFNSSSSRIILQLLSLLEEAAAAGTKVNIVWKYEEEDDNMEELGEDFSEELEHAKFTLEEVPI